MPRNSGGRRTGLTGSFMPGGSMRSNFKPIQDVEARNLTVNQAASVAGNLGVSGAATINGNLGVSGDLNVSSSSKFQVPVVSGGHPTECSAAGLIVVDKDANTGKLYFSRLNSVEENARAAVAGVSAGANQAADLTAVRDAANGVDATSNVAQAMSNANNANLNLASLKELANEIATKHFEWVAVSTV